MKGTLSFIAYIAKAIYATVIAFLASIATVLVGDVGVGDVTDGQWLTAILAGLIAGGGVYSIKNAKSPSG